MKTIAVGLSIALLASGCVTTAITEKFVPAHKIEAPPQEASLVAVPTVKALPEEVDTEVPVTGQLKEVEAFVAADKRKSKSPVRTIERANERAAQSPDDARYINAIMVYDYMPGALYKIYTSPIHISDIMLQPGEVLTSPPAAGDTVRWVVSDTISGSGTSERVHVLIKPIAPGLQTNLVLTTDRHVYHLEAKSFKNTYQAGVSWNYPHEELAGLKRKKVAENRQINQVVGRVNIASLNFDYRIKGRAAWRPERVFDDGQKTFIKFPAAVSRTEIPPLFVLSREEKPQIVNYRFNNDYYIVDRLFEKALLQIGEKKQQKVTIENNRYFSENTPKAPTPGAE